MKEEPLSLEELTAAVRRGRRFKYLFFWGHTPNSPGAAGPWFLSQWFGAPFVVDGQRYPTAEHYMMAAKALLLDDEKALDAILGAGSPGEAKSLGRQVRGFQQGTWDRECFRIVCEANLAKFDQNVALRHYLLGTKSRLIVEASPNDRVWGIGMAADDSSATNPLLWKGRNLLGFALMDVRRRLRRTDRQRFRVS